MTDTRGHRFLLVTPTNAINPRTGGGQRTALLYEALSSMGPTEVLLIGLDARTQVNGFFKTAPAVHAIEVEGIGAMPRSRSARLRRQVQRLLTPTRLYAKNETAARFLNDLVVQRGITCIIYRYTPAATITDAAGGATSRLSVIVDVDDLEDYKYKSLITLHIGSFFANSTLICQNVMALRRQVATVLDKISRIWIVKNDDRLNINYPLQTVIPNIPLYSVSPQEIQSPSSSPNILFIGSANYRPNIDGVTWFTKHVWPIVSQKSSDTNFYIVGTGDWSKVQRYTKRDSRVKFLGRVDEIRLAYARTRVAIVPIFAGAGSQIKLIEACAHGRPIVSSVMSSKGFGDEIANLTVATDAPEAFADACLDYLNDDALADAVGAALKDAQLRNYSRELVSKRIQKDVFSVLPTLV